MKKFYILLTLIWITASALVIVHFYNKKPLSLPSTVLVNGQTIQIVHEPFGEHPDWADYSVSKYEPLRHKITINPKIIIDRQQEVELYWHESMHAIDHKILIQEILDNPNYSNYEKEEMIVYKLTPEIIRFINDNHLPTK